MTRVIDDKFLIARALALVKGGLQYWRVSQMLGISTATIHKWVVAARARGELAPAPILAKWTTGYSGPPITLPPIPPRRSL